MAKTVKFLDRIGGTVLLDLSPSTTTALRIGDGGVQAPPPPIIRQAQNNPLTDGSVVTSQPYGMRLVTLPIVSTTGIQATGAAESAARRAAVTSLMRVLQRERVWLELWPDGAAEARYLQCYRSTDDKMMAQLEGLGVRWAELNVELLADPFAYGPSVSITTQTPTLANDFRTTILGSSVAGDVPTPVVVSIDGENTNNNPRTVFMASKVGGAKHKCIVEFSALANGTAPAGSTFTAGVTPTSPVLNVTADKWSAVATGQQMIVGDGAIITTPAGTADALTGSYRVFLYCPTDTVSDGERWAHELRLPVSAAYAPIGLAGTPVGRRDVFTVATAVSGSPAWADLGVVELPYGGRSPALGFGAPAPVSPASLQVLATLEANGPGRERLYDTLVVLPADDTMLCLQWTNSTAGTRTFHVDPITGTVGVRQGANNVSDASKVSAIGSTPFVVPGVDVDVFGFKLSGGNGIQLTGVPGSFSWQGTYWPRYLSVV